MQLLILAAIAAVGCATPLLGSNKCTYGPSYWCSHIEHAKECGATEHCITAVWKFNPVQVKNDAKCEMCIFAVTEARKLLKDHATQTELTAFLKKACLLAPTDKLRTECSNVVQKFLPEILALIASEVQPEAVCAVLGLCKTTTNEVEAKVQALPTTTKASSELCDDCKKFMGDIEKQLKDNQTEAQVEAILDQLCVQMGPLESMCKELVHEYLPMLFDMLTSEFDPNVICRILGLCTNGEVRDAMKLRLKFLYLMKQLPKKNLMSGTTECDICKQVIQEIQKLDRDQQTQQAVEDLLENKLCPLLGALQAECKQLIKDYAPMLFEFLANELDPDFICKALHFCTQAQQKVPTQALTVIKPFQHPKKKVRASVGCVLCEFIMQELDSFIQKNSSRDEVTKALEAVCSRLPATISAECKSFVDEYAPAVIELLLQELDPAQVCRTLGLCSKQVSTVPKTMLKVDDGPCDVCKLLIQYVDSLLKQNATVQDIIKLLEKVCNFLPATLKDQCDSIVEQYGPVVAQLIAQLADPQKVCSSIGLCVNATLPLHPIPLKPVLLQPAKPRDNTLYFQQQGQEEHQVFGLP